jgi:[acyl-carrier-protein] S-malonyltransferase
MKWLGTVAGIDLIAHGTTSDEDTIRNTAVAQPLIVSAGMVSLLSLFPHPGEAYAKVGIGAGPSVGEITAAAAANVITAEQAMVLVRERGNAMATASNVTPTGMSAVLGGDRDEVIAKLTQHGLTAANENGAGQIVAAGTLEQLAALEVDPPAGARVRPLSVAGAFHTKHMASAVGILAQHAKLLLLPDLLPTVLYCSRSVSGPRFEESVHRLVVGVQVSAQ